MSKPFFSSLPFPASYPFFVDLTLLQDLYWIQVLSSFSTHFRFSPGFHHLGSFPCHWFEFFLFFYWILSSSLAYLLILGCVSFSVIGYFHISSNFILSFSAVPGSSHWFWVLSLLSTESALFRTADSQGLLPSYSARPPQLLEPSVFSWVAYLELFTTLWWFGPLLLSTDFQSFGVCTETSFHQLSTIPSLYQLFHRFQTPSLPSSSPAFYNSVSSHFWTIFWLFPDFLAAS